MPARPSRHPPRHDGSYAEQAEARRLRILGAIAIVGILLAVAAYAGLTWRKAARATPALIERAQRFEQRAIAYEDLRPEWRGVSR